MVVFSAAVVFAVFFSATGFVCVHGRYTYTENWL